MARRKKKIRVIVRHKREKLGISQAQLAEMVGVNVKTIERFEFGHNGISSFVLDDIFLVLKIRVG